MAGIFTQKLTTLMPDGVTLAPELVTTFDWLENQGWLHIRDGATAEDHWLSIYPFEVSQQMNASLVAFGGTSLKYTAYWSTPDPQVDSRIAEIATSSGDGGRVAIWRDPDDKQWFVHLGHDTLGVITDDPKVLLQFLAMGYGEPGGLEATDITPLQQALYFGGYDDISDMPEDEGPTLTPLAFQSFLKSEFDLDMPATARDLGIADFTDYGDATSTDPFVQWMIRVTPPPTAKELAYIAELEKIAEDMNFDDLALDDTPEPQGFLGKLKSLFGSNK